MVQVNVQIENINAIRAAFRKSASLMAKNLDIAIKKAVFQIERVSMQNTPVRTGYLRASHTTTFMPLRGEVGPTASYAIYVHEGTRFMKARPFLARAVASENQSVQGFFKTAVDDTLTQIAGEANGH